jgi:fibronectin type 3 domain-containing protein
VNRSLQAAGRIAIMVLGSTLIFSWSSSPWAFRGHLTHAQSAQPRLHSVDLKWKASASRVVGYYIYRSEKAEGPYTKLNDTPVRQTRYTDRAVRSGHIYFYKVTAVDSKGHESTSSNQIKVIVPSA